MTIPDAGQLTPLIKKVAVPAPPERAFHLFTAEISAWWPLLTHSIAEAAARRITFPSSVGGQIVEYDDDGPVGAWGTVTDWDPPAYVSFSWHPGTDPAEATRVSVRFTPVAEGTEVELVHDGWERRTGGAVVRHNYDTGWDRVLGEYVAGVVPRD
jgi:uncharacterized protein YndB with AHSA1/START domain